MAGEGEFARVLKESSSRFRFTARIASDDFFWVAKCSLKEARMVLASLCVGRTFKTSERKLPLT